MNAHGAPELDPNSDMYAHCQVADHFATTPDAFFKWYTPQRLEDFLLGTLIVPPITHTEMLEGPAWGETGCARKIFFKDKTTALERIVSTDYPRSYTYQPWAYTSPVKILSDYAKASTTVEPEGDGIRVVWDYAFHARNRIVLPLLKLFVNLDWKRNMTKGMTVLREHIATHGTNVDLKRQV